MVKASANRLTLRAELWRGERRRDDCSIQDFWVPWRELAGRGKARHKYLATARRAGNRFVSVPRDLVTRAFKEWSRCVFHGVRGAGELITRASKV